MSDEDVQNPSKSEEGSSQAGSQPTNERDDDHEHEDTFRPLVFRKGGVQTKYALALDGIPERTEVEVTFNAAECVRSGRTDDVEYEVIIQKAQGRGIDTYSMITLGIQSALFDVTIHTVTSPTADAYIERGKEVFDLSAKGSVTIERAQPAGMKFVDGTVAFLTFPGERCIMNVSAAGRSKLTTKWDIQKYKLGASGGHDNVPPGGSSER